MYVGGNSSVRNVPYICTLPSAHAYMYMKGDVFWLLCNGN